MGGGGGEGLMIRQVDGEEMNAKAWDVFFFFFLVIGGAKGILGFNS